MDIREATAEDAQQLFDWRNEPAVREMSLESGPLDWEAHLRWFNKALLNEDLKILMVMEEQEPIGTFRLERLAPSLVLISIILSPTSRGKGYGSSIIQAASAVCEKYFGSVTIRACIKAGNSISQKAFAKAGYQLDAYIMEFRC